MHRRGSAFPKYLVEDARYGHQVPGHAEAVKAFKEQDRASAAELIVMAAEVHKVHIEIGTLGWSGLPLFGAAMSFELRDELLDRRAQYIGAAAILRLSWGDVRRLPSYTEGQYSWHEAGEQAWANYLAPQTPTNPRLP
jgi:hypothetical protein